MIAPILQTVYTLSKHSAPLTSGFKQKEVRLFEGPDDLIAQDFPVHLTGNKNQDLKKVSPPKAVPVHMSGYSQLCLVD